MGLCYLLQPSVRNFPVANAGGTGWVEPGPRLIGRRDLQYILKLTWSWDDCCGDYTEAKLWRRVNPLQWFLGSWFTPQQLTFPFSGPSIVPRIRDEFNLTGFSSYTEIASFNPSEEKDWYVGPQTTIFQTLPGVSAYWEDAFALTLRACGGMWILANGIAINWGPIEAGADVYYGYSDSDPFTI